MLGKYLIGWVQIFCVYNVTFISAENEIEKFELIFKTSTKMGYFMSLEMHFLHLPQEFFPGNLDAITDERDERFYLDIQSRKARYQDFWNEGMIGDYCWMLLRENQSFSIKRKSYSKHF